MAAKEMYDYLSSATADVNITLGAGAYEIHPQGVIAEHGTKNAVILEGDDGSEQRVSLSDDSIFHMTLSWEHLTESEAGILFDFYHDSAKGNGRQKSFKWESPWDGHTYVVRFDCDLDRERKAYDVFGFMNVKFKVLGYV